MTEFKLPTDISEWNRGQLDSTSYLDRFYRTPKGVTCYIKTNQKFSYPQFLASVSYTNGETIWHNGYEVIREAIAGLDDYVNHLEIISNPFVTVI